VRRPLDEIREQRGSRLGCWFLARHAVQFLRDDRVFDLQRLEQAGSDLVASSRSQVDLRLGRSAAWYGLCLA
jgi:hypothetical protein